VKRRLILLLGIGALVFVLIQLVPYGRAHDNPPVSQPVDWDNVRTEQLNH